MLIWIWTTTNCKKLEDRRVITSNLQLEVMGFTRADFQQVGKCLEGRFFFLTRLWYLVHASSMLTWHLPGLCSGIFAVYYNTNYRKKIPTGITVIFYGLCQCVLYLVAGLCGITFNLINHRDILRLVNLSLSCFFNLWFPIEACGWRRFQRKPNSLKGTQSWGTWIKLDGCGMYCPVNDRKCSRDWFNRIPSKDS